MFKIKKQFLLMNDRSFISVKAMLILALAVILVIGIVLGVQILFPAFSTGPVCVEAQIEHIREMNRLSDEVKKNGITQSHVPFKVEYCVNCIYYYSPNQSLAVNYTTDPTSIHYYEVSLPWENIEDESSSRRCDDMTLTDGKTCLFEISLSSVRWMGVC